MILRTMLSLLLLGNIAAAQELPPSPPIATPGAPGLMLIEMEPGEAQCEGGPVSLARFERPLPVSATGNRDAMAVPITLRFRIDAQGRPLAITTAVDSAWNPDRLFYNSTDVVPAFAASRFAPGAERKSCSIRLTPRAYTAATAPLPLVRRYFVAPHQRHPEDAALFRRMHPADSDCTGPGAPKVRLRGYPAFETLPQAPGTWAYAMAGFDIDARGKPRNVEIVGSDGEPAMDRATVQAVRVSRFAPAARQGCTYPYYRRSTVSLAAPAMPDKASFVPADAHCAEGDNAWTSMPALRFPLGFEARRVEGWAILGYDVAPWGQVGNIRVLAAEPAAAFGDTAREIAGMLRQAPSATGRSGCVEVFRFVMAEGVGPVEENVAQ